MTTNVLTHIAAMQGYVPGAQPATAVAKLNTNESAYPPTPRVAAAIQRASRTLNRYPQPDSAALVAAASAVYGVDPSMILACNGADEALTSFVRATIGSGDTVAMLSPTYPLYATLVAQQQGRVRQVTMTELTPDVGADPDVAWTILARPNSPCGRCVDRRLIAGWPGPLLVDEAYVEFGASSVVDLLAAKPDLVIVRTLSKAYGLAGARVGFLLAQPQLVQNVAKVRGVYTVDRLAAAAGIAALADQRYLRHSVAKSAEERRYLCRELAALGLDGWDEPVNFVWVPHADANAISGALAERGVYVRPFLGGLRVTVGTRRENSAFVRALRIVMAAREHEKAEGRAKSSPLQGTMGTMLGQ